MTPGDFKWPKKTQGDTYRLNSPKLMCTEFLLSMNICLFSVSDLLFDLPSFTSPILPEEQGALFYKWGPKPQLWCFASSVGGSTLPLVYIHSPTITKKSTLPLVYIHKHHSPSSQLYPLYTQAYTIHQVFKSALNHKVAPPRIMHKHYSQFG